MSADFTTAETYPGPREPTELERTIRARELAAERAEARGNHEVAEDHRLSAEILRKDIPPVGTPRVRGYDEIYAAWAAQGGDPSKFAEEFKASCQNT
jgi:hypothetical protein